MLRAAWPLLATRPADGEGDLLGMPVAGEEVHDDAGATRIPGTVAVVTRTIWSAVRTASAGQQSVASRRPASQPMSRMVRQVSFSASVGSGTSSTPARTCWRARAGRGRACPGASRSGAGRRLGGAGRGEPGGGDRAALDDSDRGGGSETRLPGRRCLRRLSLRTRSRRWCARRRPGSSPPRRRCRGRGVPNRPGSCGTHRRSPRSRPA